MEDFYRLLGLSRRADGQTIKAAYYALVRRFHPDVNAAAEAGRRIREINLAYDTLRKPEAKSSYDQDRARTRRRRRVTIFTGMASFALTLSLLLLPWVAPRAPVPPSVSPDVADTGPSEPAAIIASAKVPDCHDMDLADLAQIVDGPPLGCAAKGVAKIEPRSQPLADTYDEAPAYERTVAALHTPAELSLASQGDPLEPAPAARPKPARWVLLDVAKAGFELKYPAEVLLPRSDAGDSDDHLFVSPDGRALMRVYSQRGTSEVAVSKYREALMARRYAGAHFDYTPLRDFWFVLSGTVGDEMFYERVTFSCDRRSFHGWLLTYPVSERAFYDAIVEDIHRSYRFGKLAGWRCSASPAPEAARQQQQTFVPPF